MLGVVTIYWFGFRIPLRIIVNPSVVVVNDLRFESVTDQADTLH